MAELADLICDDYLHKVAYYERMCLTLRNTNELLKRNERLKG